MAYDAKGFLDAVVTEKPYPVFCYRSAKHVYEEQLCSGRLTSAGSNAAGYMLNVLDSMPTRSSPDIFGPAQTFSFTANGSTLDCGWREESFKRDGGSCVLSLAHDAAGLKVRVVTELDGTAVMSRSLVIENVSGSPVNIGNITVLGGLLEHIDGWKDYLELPQAEKLYSLGYFEFSVWGHEGAFRFHDLPAAGYSVFGRYRADRFRHPMFLLRSNATGLMWNVQFAWTAGYAFDFNLRTDGNGSDLFFAVKTDGPEPFLRLAPGETYAVPAVHFGLAFGTLDDSVNEMHEHLRRSVFTLPSARGLSGLVECGMGPERLMDVRATKHFADTAAALGAETLIIDAGWYCPPGTECTEWWKRAGDWYPDPERYPNGIGEIRDYIHSKGLLFGLWFDLERLGAGSRAFAEHPDWVLKTAAGEAVSLLDLTNPEAAAWAESELARAIADYGIDLFRLDYNVNNSDMFCPDAAGESCCARYYAAAYAMYGRLRRRFPDVVFENCAGGGGRTDIGMVANFTHTWVSDWQIAPRSAAIVNGMTMALPPEYVDRLVSGMNSHTRGSLEFTARVTIFGRPTTNDYNAVGSTFNPEQISFVRHTFDIYKQQIRPYLSGSRIFHHTPEIFGEQPHGDLVLERASADGAHGVIGAFRLSDVSGGRADTAVTVFPRGLDASAVYRVTRDNTGRAGKESGAELIERGIRIPLGGALTSELIVLEKTDG